MSEKGEVKKERNVGLDLFRIVSMFMVTILHVVGHGGILESCEVFSINYNIACLFDIFAKGAVDCFVLVTGYLYCKKKFKISNIIGLWCQVEFYSVIVTFLIKYGIHADISSKDLISSFLPIIRNQYWYFIQYFALFFMIPFLNIFINNVNKKQFRCLLLVNIMLLCVMATVSLIDLFKIYDGYSFTWFVVLYLFGAYIKMYENDIKYSSKRIFAVFLGCNVMIFLSKFVIEHITFMIKNEASHGDLLVSYTSPFVLLSSLCLLILFTRMKIVNNSIRKLIFTLAPLSFGVYLIHDNVNFRDFIMRNRFVSYTFDMPIVFLGKLVLTIIVIFSACMIIDYFRNLLFKLLRINTSIKKVDKLVAALYEKC